MRQFCLALSVIALGLLHDACTKGPTSPSAGGLQIVAPSELAPGESVVLTALVARSDGFSVDVTRQAQWVVQSAATNVLEVSGTGVATARDRGRALVTVRYRGMAADATILVLPKQTFTLTGRITAGSAGLANVAITVIAGVGEGLSARTSSSGDYELFGVAGAVQIRASKDGYFDRSQAVTVAAHASRDFELTASRTRADYSGAYTLIVTGGACTAGFPEEAKRRVYTARVEQTGADLRVSLSRPGLAVGAFNGVINASGDITFTVRTWLTDIWEDYSIPDWVDRLNDGSELILEGHLVARITPAAISGGGDPALGGASFFTWRRSPPQTCPIDRFELVAQ